MNEDHIYEAQKDANLDPLTGAPGAHPLGTGAGATGGGLAGAAIGSMAGPIGAGVGIVVGAIAGGYAGKAAAESFDPTSEEAYWRANYASRTYVTKGETYEQYQQAYRVGYESFERLNGRDFEDVENELRGDYNASAGKNAIGWDKARRATRDAWERLEDTTRNDQ